MHGNHEWVYEEQADNVITEMIYGDCKVTIIVAPTTSIKGDGPLGEEADLIPLPDTNEALIALSQSFIDDIYKNADSPNHASFAFGVNVGQLCCEGMGYLLRRQEENDAV
jgi:hypothetical protein